RFGGRGRYAQKSISTAVLPSQARLTCSFNRLAASSIRNRSAGEISGLGLNYFHQLEMQSDEFEIIMQVDMRQTADMHLAEFLHAGKGLAAPHLFRNIAELDVIDLDCANDAL
ncbi:MAG TPA: hypothetical protein VF798_05320, partial [Burkholderiaceae bacterium]